MSRISNYPHLIGVSDDERKELHGVNEVAAFICDQGRFGDLRVCLQNNMGMKQKKAVKTLYT